MDERPGLAVDDSKLTGYLLDVEHPEGWSKARFFIAQGFSPARPKELALALIGHGMAYWPGVRLVGKFGPKHVLEGALNLPIGGSITIRSVWQLRADRRAWLVTAYPM